MPLDKRLAADGRGLQQLHINENFAKLAEALYIADRKAREAVETRAQLEKKLAQKEKEAKEEHLRQLAQRARDERAGIKVAPGNSLGSPCAEFNGHLVLNSQSRVICLVININPLRIVSSFVLLFFFHRSCQAS